MRYKWFSFITQNVLNMMYLQPCGVINLRFQPAECIDSYSFVQGHYLTPLNLPLCKACAGESCKKRCDKTAAEHKENLWVS